MVVLIAMLTGIADYVALLALFAANAAMIFLGWLMELLNPPDRAGRAGCPSCRLRRRRRGVDRDRGADRRLGGTRARAADLRLRVSSRSSSCSTASP